MYFAEDTFTRGEIPVSLKQGEILKKNALAYLLEFERLGVSPMSANLKEGGVG